MSRSAALRLAAFLFVLTLLISAAGAQTVAAPVDSDGDGLSDALEQQLLGQFSPAFQIGREDCAGLPAEFRPGLLDPTPAAENGTIYGEAFPARNSTPQNPLVELHFYHLWRTDCGAHGHPLDSEHVAALVGASSNDPSTATWKALYWYAAAHENTVCDVSQVARASTLHAEDKGAKVWISPGKHASYLNETLCRRGCGADRCEAMTPLHTTRIINLGEPRRPMNGSVFIASSRWPLVGKMAETNFASEPLARLNAMPSDDIAWYNPGRHPAQGIISISSTTEQAIAGSGDNTGAAISLAEDKTGNALDRSFHSTTHALGTSWRHVSQALTVKPKEQ